MNKAIQGLLGTLMVFALAGCTVVNAATAPTPVGSASVDENPYGGFDVANPAPDEVILTVTKGKQTTNYSLNDLKKLKSREITILEPFVKKQQTYVGVPMATFFDAVGIKPTDKVSTLALNDYKYDDLARHFSESQGLIAYLRDGSEIPMDEGGPIRIVFPVGTPYFDFVDAWNWSIRSIDTVG